MFTQIRSFVLIGLFAVLAGCAQQSGGPAKLGENCVYMSDSKSARKLVCFENINGEAVVEGDIGIGKVADLKRHASIAGRQALSIATGSLHRWPNAVVPYFVDNSATQYQALIDSAINEYNSRSIIQLRPSVASDLTRIVFTNGSSEFPSACGLSEQLGLHSRTEEQHVYLWPRISTSTCSGAGTVIHELGHALGLHHEQNREDRDRYIRIQTSNLMVFPNGATFYDRILSSAQDIGPYDLFSVMHYAPGQGVKAGSAGGAFVRVDGGSLEHVGEKKQLSAGDISALAALYSADFIEAPDALQVSQIGRETAVLGFQDNSDNEAEFKIEIAGPLGSPVPANPSYRPYGSIPASAGIHQVQTPISGLRANSIYLLRVSAVGASSSGSCQFPPCPAGAPQSVPSAPVQFLTLPPPSPAAPANLVATSKSSTSIELGWSAPAGPVSSYAIHQALNASGPWTLNKYSTNETSFQVPQLSPNTVYFFQVVAINAGGTSPLSITASATTLPLPPSAPTLLVAEPNTDTTKLNLSWKDNSNNETSFKIERSLSADGPWVDTLIPVPENAQSAVDSGLLQNTKYYYRISALNSGGASSFALANGATQPVKPEVPTGVALSVVTTASVKVEWQDASPFKTGYKIVMATAQAGPWTPLTPNVAANLRTYTVPGLIANKKYFFRVRTLNGTNSSDPSNIVSITVGTPKAATAAAPVAVSSSQINVTWTDNSDNEASFAVHMKQGAAGTYARVPVTMASGTNSYRITGLLPGKKYFFKVRAINLAGFTDSAPVNATTLAH